MDVIAAYLRIRSISSFPYLDDWLVKNLLRQKLISQTIFRHRSIQILGFIPNLDKSDLIPSQKFTFIGIEFLTHQNIVKSTTRWQGISILDNQSISISDICLGSNFLSLLGKLSSAADLVVLDRLYLGPLQMCLQSVWTSPTSSWSSHSDYEFNPLPSELVDRSQPPYSGDLYPSTWSHIIPFYKTPVILDWVLIWDRWVYAFIVVGQKTNPNSTSIF